MNKKYLALVCFISTSIALTESNNDIALGWTTAPFAPFGSSNGDQTLGVAIDTNGNVILAGLHSPDGTDPQRFAALQLIPNMSGGVDLGWVTAPLEPFGPSNGDQALGIAIDADGNIILAGLHNPVGESPKFAALQLRPNMSGGVDLGWATAPFQPFGPSDADQANGVAIDADGNIILAGRHKPVGGSNRFAALQLIPNVSGGVNLGWTTAPFQPFGPSDTDQANGVAIDTDGNSILAGIHNPVGESPKFAALQLRPNMSGGVDLGWATALFEPFGPSNGDRANGVAIDVNENIILAGMHNPVGESPKFAALQLIPNISGNVNLDWATAPLEPFGPSDSDQANGIAIDANGNVILAGSHNPDGVEPDRFAALQLMPNMSGGVDLGWATAPSEPFGPSNNDQANSVAIDVNGSIVLGGIHDIGRRNLKFAALQLIPTIEPLPASSFVAALINKYGPFCPQ